MIDKEKPLRAGVPGKAGLTKVNLQVAQTSSAFSSGRQERLDGPPRRRPIRQGVCVANCFDLFARQLNLSGVSDGLSRIAGANQSMLGKLRCLGDQRPLPVRRSATISPFVVRTAERLPIKGLKFGRFRNNRLHASANQGEGYCFHSCCFHIFFSLLIFPS